jgi:hypothetical protein
MLAVGVRDVRAVARTDHPAAGADPRRPNVEVARRPRVAASRPTRPDAERVEVPPPPFSDGIFPVLGLPRRPARRSHARRELTDMHAEIELRARRGAPVVPGLS